MKGALKDIAAPKTNGTSPLPSSSKMTTRPANGFGPKKPSTHHDLMEVWLNTPDEEQRRFMSAVGLTFRIVEDREPTPKANGTAAADQLIAEILPDLSISRFYAAGVMKHRDRAGVIATAIIRIVRDFVTGWFHGGTLHGLHAALTEYLRDEIPDIEQQTISDTRPQDE